MGETLPKAYYTKRYFCSHSVVASCSLPRQCHAENLEVANCRHSKKGGGAMKPSLPNGLEYLVRGQLVVQFVLNNLPPCRGATPLRAAGKSCISDLWGKEDPYRPAILDLEGNALLLVRPLECFSVSMLTSASRGVLACCLDATLAESVTVQPGGTYPGTTSAGEMPATLHRGEPVTSPLTWRGKCPRLGSALRMMVWYNVRFALLVSS